jgi:hypothetical protein
MNGRSRHLMEVAGVLTILIGSVSCGNVSRTGRSPSLLVIDSLQGASVTSSGNTGAFGIPLESDVFTKGSVFADLGKVAMHLVLKDPGNPGAPATPSDINAITLTRYHVEFVRADGRNTQGIDVPYAFDGGASQTVTVLGAVYVFELVRVQAKLEAPLLALANLGGRIVISTIANVTFYGQDQAGNEVSVTGSISVDFADYADAP